MRRPVLRRSVPPWTRAKKKNRARLVRIVAEEKGANPVEARETQFKKSNALIDLANLLSAQSQLNAEAEIAATAQGD